MPFILTEVCMGRRWMSVGVADVGERATSASAGDRLVRFAKVSINVI